MGKLVRSKRLHLGKARAVTAALNFSHMICTSFAVT